MPEAVGLDDVIDIHSHLSDLCFSGMDLAELGSHYSAVLNDFRQYGRLSPAAERFVLNDDQFLEYLRTPNSKSPQDVLYAVEGIVKDIFTAIFNFLKRIVTGLWDFIRKIFGLQKNVKASNESNIKKLRPLFDKYQSDLDKIKLPESVPHMSKVEGVLHKLESILREVVKFDVTKLDSQVNAILDGKSEEADFQIDFAKIIGPNYVDDLNDVGISLEEDLPVFESVFNIATTDSTIRGLGYNYSEIVHLLGINEKGIHPLRTQMEKMTKTFEKITNNISKLKNKLQNDDSAKEKYQGVLEVLPKEISKITGLYHKLATACLAYEYKMADIIKCHYEALKYYNDSNGKTK